ncbi:hypothetical protein RND81_03G052300 [Saponaria officinalis]|uniref:AIG1-type G domain-containing protein n=1 Tax=Saponaria officinalis TaxID=3572 RepID=A0AAW1M7U9_SAPOF
MDPSSEYSDESGNGGDLVLATNLNKARTIVLVGRAGNGKSATGNSILGKTVFHSVCSSTGVTSITEMHSTEFNDGHVNGRVINVIDTIGLFDSDVNSSVLGKEIVKCVDLAKDGIHALVLVLSVRTRFTTEEATSLKILMGLFGPEFPNYMIVLFTGGDELRERNETLDDYLRRGCSDALNDVFRACNNRRLLFDNTTNDSVIQGKQRQDLFELIEKVLEDNGQKPYTDQTLEKFRENRRKLSEIKKATDTSAGCTRQDMLEMRERLQREHEEHSRQMAGQIEARLMEIIERFREELEREYKARLDGGFKIWRVGTRLDTFSIFVMFM